MLTEFTGDGKANSDVYINWAYITTMSKDTGKYMISAACIEVATVDWKAHGDSDVHSRYHGEFYGHGNGTVAGYINGKAHGNGGGGVNGDSDAQGGGFTKFHDKTGTFRTV